MSLTVLENCDDCGACCQHIAVPPFCRDANFDEIQERMVPDDLRAELEPLWEIRFQLPERPCLWYDESRKQCRHYEFRPQACRDFEINSPSCLASRRKQGVPS
ncbi:MAG: YkgJ family cysteine cluster protein [Planctomycetaceae bacterium]|nr:YkgJ family cysteine cluster protein [Planctomycetaceae bacterium]